MDRAKAIRELNLAIEALREELQLSGETSTISEKHQLILTLDDAVKVVGRICDEWWTLEDGDIEFIRNELEQKCYRIDQTTDCISRADAIAYIDRIINSGLGRKKSLDYIRKYIYALPPVNQKQITGKLETAEIATSEGEESTMNQPKSKLDCISRQQAIDEVKKMEIDKISIVGFWELIESLPPVTPTERTGITTDIAFSLHEEIRCEVLCTNPMKSDRGCDGGCQYDTELLKRIDEVIERVIVDSPTETTGEWIENAPEGQDIDPPYICSACGYAESRRTPFCEQCRAKMKG